MWENHNILFLYFMKTFLGVLRCQHWYPFTSFDEEEVDYFLQRTPCKMERHVTKSVCYIKVHESFKSEIITSTSRVLFFRSTYFYRIKFANGTRSTRSTSLLYCTKRFLFRTCLAVPFAILQRNIDVRFRQKAIASHIILQFKLRTLHTCQCTRISRSHRWYSSTISKSSP